MYSACVYVDGCFDPVLEAQPIAGRQSLHATLEHLAGVISQRGDQDIMGTTINNPYWNVMDS